MRAELLLDFRRRLSVCGGAAPGVTLVHQLIGQPAAVPQAHVRGEGADLLAVDGEPHAAHLFVRIAIARLMERDASGEARREERLKVGLQLTPLHWHRMLSKGSPGLLTRSMRLLAAH